MKLRNVIFYVKNLKKSHKFYENLGFQLSKNYGKFISYKTDTDNTFFSIMETDDIKKEPGKQVCTFWTSNIGGLFQKCKLLGIAIDTDLTKTDFGLMFAIKDIDGNKIEFVEIPSAAASEQKAESTHKTVDNGTTIITRNSLYETIKYIANKTYELKNKHVDEKNMKIDYLTIFSHDEKELENYNKLLSAMGKMVYEHNGPTYKLFNPITLPKGEKLSFLRIREPDIERPHIGCDDFTVNNYEDFKNEYINKDIKHILVVKRPEFEMIEIRDENFDVLTYIPDEPFSKMIKSL